MKWGMIREAEGRKEEGRFGEGREGGKEGVMNKEEKEGRNLSNILSSSSEVFATVLKFKCGDVGEAAMHLLIPARKTPESESLRSPTPIREPLWFP